MQRVFSRILPIIGHITVVLTTLTGGFITFITLRIASSKNNEDNSSSSNALSILGTILASIMSIIMYIYSDATKVLTDLGQNIDNSFAETCQQNYERLPSHTESGDSAPSYLKKSIPLLAMSFVSANVLIAGISTYQGGILLVDKYLDLYPDMQENERENYREILRYVVYTLVFAGGYRALAFEGSFAAKLAEGITNKFLQSEPLVQHDSELPINTRTSVYFQYQNERAHTTSRQPTLTHDIEAQPRPQFQ